ncbi:electron transfer flavoprotein subunit alpha/FixB family protein [Aquirufa sp. ROCK2-A2]
MKNIHIFIESRNNSLSDSSQKVLNYFKEIKGQFLDYSIKVHHFISDKSQAISQIEMDGISSISNVIYNENNLFADKSEFEALLESLNHASDSKYLFAKSMKLESIASFIANEYNLPVLSNILSVQNGLFKKEIFSGKAVVDLSIHVASWVVIFAKSLKVNTSSISSSLGNSDQSLHVGASSIYHLESISKLGNSIPLPEAQIVVGAGRGLKDPSNWGIIEDLANKIGAATACSKPVSDLDWRPHHEHVGQTGVKISPKLYIACGISGAIQHLAGVNNSGKIVVINNDPEAPFFKNADYGIVGDVFDVIPRLLKKLN